MNETAKSKVEPAAPRPIAAKSNAPEIKPVKTAPSSAPTQPRPASPARVRKRHWWMILSFLLFVLAPSGFSGWYLYFVAEDQYASQVGFSVRKEETGSAIELLGGITELSGSSSNDTDILFEFIQSQNMVRLVSQEVDLRKIYFRENDPVFSLPSDARIEALSAYWKRMVSVFYDRSSGLIEIRVKAFDPADAQKIAQVVFDQSTLMINRLSAIARDDATRYAKEELDKSIERQKIARTAITSFRLRTRIVDPLADIQGRMGLVNTLQAQLAAALIELDLISSTSREGDPRIQQAQRRVEVIQDRIAAERESFSESGQGNAEQEAYSELVSEYEALVVDREYAEKSYLSALATYDLSLAEAQRQSRYLASHIEPTLAETAEFPRKPVTLGVLISILFIAWSIMIMIYYSLRDRR